MMELASLPKESLESVPCGLCRSCDAKRLFSIRGFPVLRCQSCGMSYVSPRLNPDKLRELYSDEKYFKSDNSLVCGYVDYESDRKNILVTFKRRFDWLLKESKRSGPGRILDIGCATGFSIEFALGRGWDAWGIEPSAFAAGLAREKFGDRVQQGTLSDMRFPDHHFDTVLIWDVIEHLPDPLQTLATLHRSLKKGGFISLITPDAGSVLARFLGRHWMEYAKPTEHIYFFTRKTMSEAAQKAGLKTVVCSTAGKYVGGDVFVDRFCAYVPAVKWLKKSAWLKPFLSSSVYVDPRDKMMVLLTNKEDAR